MKASDIYDKILYYIAYFRDSEQGATLGFSVSKVVH